MLLNPLDGNATLNGTCSFGDIVHLIGNFFQMHWFGYLRTENCSDVFAVLFVQKHHYYSS